MKCQNIGSAIAKLVEAYFHCLKFAVAALLAAMVVLVFGNVVLRYAFNSGISVSEEVSRWFFVWLTFLGALVGMREHAHLGVDAVVNRLSPLGKKVCLVAGQGLMLYTAWLLLDGSWEQTVINWDVKAPTSGWSMGLFYGIGVVFAATAMLILLADLYRVLSGQLGDHELVMVRESEDLHGEEPESEAAAPILRVAHGGKR